MKRRILLVDDEITVLLTMKAILEISGFNVDTAASAREGRQRIKTREYEMIITDMRMETDESGREVIQAARNAEYHPAVALLTAFPVSEDDWQDMGADKMLVKPMHTQLMLAQIEKLFAARNARLAKLSGVAAAKEAVAAKKAPKKSAAKKSAVVKKAVVKSAPAKKLAKKKKR